MRRLVFDSDGLIKTVRAGLLEPIAREFECCLTKEVEEETIKRGKEKMHDDAFAIEDAVRQGLLKVMPAARMDSAETTLGKGELSAAALFRQIGGEAIVSDDKKFLDFLQQNGVPFATPTRLLVAMEKNKKINRTAAQISLEKLKPLVSRNAYETAFKQLGGELK